jgi:hypothetical protein
MILECSTKEELEALKEKAMKIKIICLDEMDKHPLCNPSFFNKRDKDKLLQRMGEMMRTYSNEEIEKKVASIVNERLLTSGADVSNYPIYDTTAINQNTT